MPTPGKPYLAVLVFLLLAGGCSTRQTRPQTEDSVALCHIIYDAGSQGTRLYIYEQLHSGWLGHSGPKVGAMADPVRANRGKTMADAGAVVNDIVNALEQMRRQGPVDGKGEPEWLAFDWRQNCDIQSASVYATAGMRLAEEKSAEDSKILWGMLNQRLSQTLEMAVTTRTLSGYEEGLFAWMAISRQQPNLDFGMAEMGGGSIQIAFPCSNCTLSRNIKVEDQKVAIYSRSFLGWGQDEAWRKFGSSKACELGAARRVLDWEDSDCNAGMPEFKQIALDAIENIDAAGPGRWFLSDAFRYMKNDDVEKYCRQGNDDGYEPESACFRAVFLQRILETLGVPVDSKQSDADWTLGAVMCTANQCLDSDQEPVGLDRP